MIGEGETGTSAKTDETGMIRQQVNRNQRASMLAKSTTGGELSTGLTTRPDGSQALSRREPAQKPTRPYPTCTYSYRRTCVALPETRKTGLSSNERHGGRVTVVVVGVTSHQGARESRAQGKGSQVLSFKSGTDGGVRPHE